MASRASLQRQLGVALGVVLLALGLGYGASAIPGESGYAGVGPNFLPWLVAVALLACGALLVYESRSGGFRDMEEEDEGATPYWPGFLYMSAGLLLNAALITRLGFVLSCALCFMLAARGLRSAAGQPQGQAASWLRDLVLGLLIAAPVYWMFTKFLAINLPGLTGSGWL